MKEKFEKEVDDIVSMLDGFMEQGGGRMNIDATSVSPDTESTIENQQYFGCSVVKGRKMACQVPTLLEGLDFDDEKN